MKEETEEMFIQASKEQTKKLIDEERETYDRNTVGDGQFDEEEGEEEGFEIDEDEEGEL